MSDSGVAIPRMRLEPVLPALLEPELARLLSSGVLATAPRVTARDPAQQPLTLAILDATDGHPALGAAEAKRVRTGSHGRLVAPRPIAERLAPPSSTRVTTPQL